MNSCVLYPFLMQTLVLKSYIMLTPLSLVCLGFNTYVGFNVPHVFVSEKAVFRPSDEAVFTTLGVNTHLFACEPSELESLVRTVGETVM